MPRSKPPRKQPARSASKTPRKAGQSPLPDRRAVESVLAQLVGSSAGHDAVEQAQSVMYEAWEAPTPPRHAILRGAKAWP